MLLTTQNDNYLKLHKIHDKQYTSTDQVPIVSWQYTITITQKLDIPTFTLFLLTATQKAHVNSRKQNS